MNWLEAIEAHIKAALVTFAAFMACVLIAMFPGAFFALVAIAVVVALLAVVYAMAFDHFSF